LNSRYSADVITLLAHPEEGVRGVLIYTRINVRQIGGGGSRSKKEGSQIRTTEHIETGLRHTVQVLGVNQRECYEARLFEIEPYS
jgi:hypothetical protein